MPRKSTINNKVENEKPIVSKKTKSIDVVLKNLEKAMGHENDPIVEKAPTKYQHDKSNIISFGYPEVDIASGCNGVPRGKMIEIFGPESGGKSFLTLKLIGSAQSNGLACCLVDSENSYDPSWADQNGVDTENLFIIRKPLSAEKTLDYVDKLCESGAFGLIVVDSTAALIPQKELDGNIGDQDYALLARAMSKACRKIVQNCAKTNTTCVFINQIREKMGVMFGNNETTPGGRALKFYCHQRIKVTPGSRVKVKEGNRDVVIARQSYVKFEKNKSAPPFGECIIEIVFDKTAKNPVVKLCKEAKDLKIISLREGTFRLNKDLFENEKKNIDTGTKTTVELADYLIKNDLVIKVLDSYLEKVDEDLIDSEIEKMKNNPSMIKSPMETISSEEDLESDDLDMDFDD